MKQTLQLRLSQHLALTPQLQQSIRLLQLSTLELNQEIEKFLSDNPLMERDDIEPESTPYIPGQEGVSQSTSSVESPQEKAADQQESSSGGDDAAIGGICGCWFSTGTPPQDGRSGCATMIGVSMLSGEVGASGDTPGRVTYP